MSKLKGLSKIVPEMYITTVIFVCNYEVYETKSKELLKILSVEHHFRCINQPIYKYVYVLYL